MKRVLFDENMPQKLRRDLPDFEIRTVQEEGWGGRSNGELLRGAAEHFDVFLTADQRLRYQQNPARFAIGIVVIATFDTKLSNLRRLLPQLRSAIDGVAAGSLVVIKPD